MTLPTSCVNPAHLSVAGGALAPQPWMQLRAVAGVEVKSRSGSYGVSGGAARDELLQDVLARWTNNTPLPAMVYGLVTRGGAAITLSGRTRATLATQHGLGAGAATPAVTTVSNFGCGLDRGSAGGSVPYSVVESRQGQRSNLLMLGSQAQVAPGASITARATTRFVSTFWENLPIAGGNGETESSYVTGELRIDLFAYPVI